MVGLAAGTSGARGGSLGLNRANADAAPALRGDGSTEAAVTSGIAGPVTARIAAAHANMHDGIARAAATVVVVGARLEALIRYAALP